MLGATVFAQGADPLPVPGATALAALPGLAGRASLLTQTPPFDRPLVLQSSVRGEAPLAWVETVVERPFAAVLAALEDPHQWCAALVLHVNIETCRVDSPKTAPPRIRLRVARSVEKTGGPGEDFDFLFQTHRLSDVPLIVQLNAAQGPLGSRDHEMLFAAAPLDGSRTAVRLSYRFTLDSFSKLALDLYLRTLVRDRGGFSRAHEDGRDGAVGGVRGMLERNLMLHLIALDAAAAEPRVPLAAGYRTRLRDYHAGTARYPAQLLELSLDEYVSRKEPLLRPGGARSGDR
jgi:hypothetical protein